MGKTNYKLVNISLLLIIIILLSYSANTIINVFNMILTLTLPFILGFALAYGLTPFVKALEKKKIPKNLAVILVIFIFLFLFVGVLVLSIPMLVEQTVALITASISFINEFATKNNLNLSNQIAELKDINSIITNFASKISETSFVIITWISDIAVFIVMIIISAVYFMLDMDDIRIKIKKFFKRRNKRGYQYLKVIDTEITNFFDGYWKVMLVQFIEYTIVFYLIGHPYYLIFGILASVSGVIPYIGGIIVNIFAAITALLVSQSLFIWCLIVMMIFPQIDSYIISPKIYGDTNELHPLLNIFAVFIGGALFDIMGIIAAIPVTLVIVATFKFFSKDINKKIAHIKEDTHI
ncbi:MAG: AI-2E family transporter [Bacilli bacterium]